MASSTASGSSFVGERKKVLCQHSACFCRTAAVRALLPIGHHAKLHFLSCRCYYSNPPTLPAGVRPALPAHTSAPATDAPEEAEGSRTRGGLRCAGGCQVLRPQQP